MSDSEKKFDAVNKPAHYNAGGVECIDALKAATINLMGIEAVCTANAIKYLWRWKMKNGVEDLRKAIWYIERIIAEKPKSLPETRPDKPTHETIACVYCAFNFDREIGYDHVYCSLKCAQDDMQATANAEQAKRDAQKVAKCNDGHEGCILRHGPPSAEYLAKCCPHCNEGPSNIKDGKCGWCEKEVATPKAPGPPDPPPKPPGNKVG